MENKRTTSRRGSAGRRYSSTRERILREIEHRDSVTTAEIVAQTGLHENTVREHLAQLRSDGRVRRVRRETRGRGRPGWRWQAPPADIVSPYAGLALALADGLTEATPDPVGHARRAGIRWGAQIAAQRESDPGLSEDGSARGIVMTAMREQGFEPDDTGEQVVLHRCPLLAAAARRSEVVCAVHEGMIVGMARAQHAATDATLLPFHAGGACVLRLRAAS